MYDKKQAKQRISEICARKHTAQEIRDVIDNISANDYFQLHCPFCDGADVTATDNLYTRPDLSMISTVFECENCGKEFNLYYKLQGY